ncbi:unnamed protein product [Caenorhabditis brenneri]
MPDANHMARGCPMLTLDVLTLLSKLISIVADQAPPPPPPIGVDWSKPTTSVKPDLLIWLEREVEVLQTNCDYNVEKKPIRIHDDNHDSDYWSSTGPNYDQPSDKLSRSSPTLTPKRGSRQIRSFFEQLMVTGVYTFPLLDAAVSPLKMFVSSALAYIENQGSDLFAPITKYYILYNLSQGFACCIYLSLTDVDQVYSSMLNLAPRPAPLGGSENYVVTLPVRWILCWVVGKKMILDNFVFLSLSPSWQFP